MRSRKIRSHTDVINLLMANTTDKQQREATAPRIRPPGGTEPKFSFDNKVARSIHHVAKHFPAARNPPESPGRVCFHAPVHLIPLILIEFHARVCCGDRAPERRDVACGCATNDTTPREHLSLFSVS